MTQPNSSSGILAVAAMAALSVASSQTASAVLFIDVGTHDLVADSPTPQMIELFVDNSGGSVQVGSFDFLLQIGNGLGATPFIDSVDLLTDTIFESNHSSIQEIASPQSVYYGVAKGSAGAGPTIPAESRVKIATVGIVTSGYSGGTLALDIWDFDESFTSFFTDDGNFEPIPAELGNGFLNIAPVPEPGEWAALVGAGLLGFGIWRRRTR